MLNRRTFLKTGAVALPLATALDSFDPSSVLSAETVAMAGVSGPAPTLHPSASAACSA